MTAASPAITKRSDDSRHALLGTIHGVRQLIFATQSGLVSLNAQTGGLLWRFSYPFPYGTSIGVSPVVDEDMVFVVARMRTAWAQSS
jgi:hypothetical protein